MTLTPPTTMRLRELHRTYRVLRDLPPAAAQLRGQQFNDLIAEVLRAFGLDAKANVRGLHGRDEIDVVFTDGGVDCILEAKWEQKRINADPLEKLSGRLDDRPAGTRGILLSMSGYTKHGLEAFERRGIIGLQREHFEAVLAGLLSPQDLLQRIHAAQAARGRHLVLLVDLLLPEATEVGPAPRMQPTSDTPPPWKVIVGTAPGVTAAEGFIGTWAQDCPALSLSAGSEELLIATPNGVVSFDPATCATRWALPLPGTTGRAIRGADGTLSVLCGNALVRWDPQEKDLSVLAGGFGGYATLEATVGGELWVYNQLGSTDSGSITLVRVGEQVGDEERFDIPFPAGSHAVPLSPGRFFLSGTGHSTLLDLARNPVTSEADWIKAEVQDGRAATRLDESTVLIAGNRGSMDSFLFRHDLTTQDGAERLVEFTANRVVDLAVGPGGGDGNQLWILADVQGNDLVSRPVLLRAHLPRTTTRR
ncbi:restriction endonuclease [Streptomyces vinaceus]|uniref:restriction endonuclease n=1 Tax=Streptomyces vinaceus TaxID=1960 RepID=UPI0035DCBBF8